MDINENKKECGWCKKNIEFRDSIKKDDLVFCCQSCCDEKDKQTGEGNKNVCTFC
jgi:hypothetical protein